MIFVRCYIFSAVFGTKLLNKKANVHGNVGMHKEHVVKMSGFHQLSKERKISLVPASHKLISISPSHKPIRPYIDMKWLKVIAADP